MGGPDLEDLHSFSSELQILSNFFSFSGHSQSDHASNEEETYPFECGWQMPVIFRFWCIRSSQIIVIEDVRKNHPANTDSRCTYHSFVFYGILQHFVIIEKVAFRRQRILR
jgi:hypothetical protein